MEFLEHIIKGFVAYPDMVKTTESRDDMGILITLEVDPLDVGLVIGHQGEHAKALRMILRLHGMTQQRRLSLKIAEPPGSEGQI